MDPELVRIYRSKIRHVEPAIRGVVQGLWSLPFIEDTGETCSGHVLRLDMNHGRAQVLTPEHVEKCWYHHTPILYLFYSLTENVEQRDAFREQLKGIKVTANDLEVSITSAIEDEGINYSYDLAQTRSFCGSYRFTFTEPPKTVRGVLQGEHVLARYWDEVGELIMSFNPRVDIGTAQGADFRKVINWARWNKTLAV